MKKTAPFAVELRRRRGRLSRRRAALLLGISQRAIQYYEEGTRTPPRDTDVVTMDTLLGRLPLLDAAQPANGRRN